VGNRTPEQEREWLLRMAAAEEEALENCTSGVLACSPELYRLMMEDSQVEDDGR